MQELMEHQIKALDFIRSRRGQAGIFLPPGTGKTRIAIDATRDLDYNLIICRRDDFVTWTLELTKWGISPDHISYVRSFEDAPVFHRPLSQWTLITHDLVRKFVKEVSSSGFTAAIVDESHKIKDWRTLRTKAIIRSTRRIPVRLALTGTPATEEPIDLFSQCLFVDDGYTLGYSYWKFKNRYYIKSGPGWYIRHGARQQIRNLIQPIVFTECPRVKLPSKRYLTKFVPMSGLQQRYYESLLNKWEYETHKGRTIELNNTLQRLTKLRQVASGFIYGPSNKWLSDRSIKWLNSSKLKLLEELLTSPDYLLNKPKLVIWCTWLAEIDKIYELSKKLKVKAVTYYGSNSKEANIAARVSFATDSSVHWFIGQVDSGLGMNELIVADTAVYFSNSYRGESRIQSEARICREGSQKHSLITYWDLLTEGSVDLLVLKCLQRKKSLASYILQQSSDKILQDLREAYSETNQVASAL